MDDGPEYSPDGKYIYFNSVRSGMMQIWRMKPDGKEQEQITSDGFQDWFAHPSPDGKWLIMISYLPDVPANSHPHHQHVILRLMTNKTKEIKKAITKETKDLISKARTNTLSPDEMSGATFTISNLGSYDIDGFTPVINLPEAAILGVGRIVKKPIVNENDEIVPASMMVLSL